MKSRGGNKFFSATTFPNGKIAGRDGASNSTGDQSEALGMPNHAGTGAAAYGPGGMKTDKEKTPKAGSGKAVVDEKTGMPNSVGTGANDYDAKLVDGEKEPGQRGNPKMKPGKKFKPKNIAELRDYANKRGMSA